MPQRTYRFDLHLHSCLSPCADLYWSPRAIVERALEAGLDALALTDHQSTLNCPAFAECCAAANLTAWFGLELCTREEVHVLVLFDELDPAMRFGETFIRTLPPRPNRLDAFGEQVVVEADDSVVGLEWRMLALASSLSLEDAVNSARAAGALVVASHVDRASFSVPSQLGFLTGQEGFDAVELSARCPDPVPDALDLAGYPVLRNSDAHLPEQLGRQWNEAALEAFRIPELRAALRAGRVTHRKGGYNGAGGLCEAAMRGR
jgi:PHP family Zn ribbon phosphoesterase